MQMLRTRAKRRSRTVPLGQKSSVYRDLVEMSWEKKTVERREKKKKRYLFSGSFPGPRTQTDTPSTSRLLSSSAHHLGREDDTGDEEREGKTTMTARKNNEKSAPSGVFRPSQRTD